MIPNQKILEIQQLFAEGIHSNGEIALRVGVSRGTVGNVIKGKRMLMAVEPEPKPEKPDVYTRCPKCGARALMPCIACSVKSMAPRRIHADEGNTFPVLGLNLLPKHHKRYLQIKRLKEKEESSMGLDPTTPAVDLDATQKELSSREKQNRFGQQSLNVPNIGDSGFLSILAVKTPEKFTVEQWTEILAHLMTNYGVEAMQALFELNIPTPDKGCINNLHVLSHVRMDTRVASD